jgi:hypothetical protein
MRRNIVTAIEITQTKNERGKLEIEFKKKKRACLSFISANQSATQKTKMPPAYA